MAVSTNHSTSSSRQVTLEQRQAAVKSFASPPSHGEMAKDNVPQRKVQRMDRQSSLEEFKQRTQSQAGDREPYGHGHTQDVAETTRQTRNQAAARQFARRQSAESTSKSASKSPAITKG